MNHDNPYETPIDETAGEPPAGSLGNKSGGRVVWLVLGGCIMGLVIALIIPASRNARPAALRMQCANNLKQIALALLAYQDHYDAFPPAATRDSQGQSLHSWRTLLLPFLEQQSLYDSVDLSKPWNDPVNAAAFQADPGIYRCPSTDVPDGYTTYQAVVSQDGLFRPQDARSAADLIDGPTETLIFVEVSKDKAVHWMTPSDATLSFMLTFDEETDFAHSHGTHAAFADGSVHFLSAALPESVRRAMISVAGGESLDDEVFP